MPERTAAEVLAEKLKAAWSGSVRQPCVEPIAGRLDEIAVRLAKDPAITVRTDMEVERFVVEWHHLPELGPRDPEYIHSLLTGQNWFREDDQQCIIVRSYPEGNS